MIKLLALGLALPCCTPTVIDLGQPDAAIDAMIDAPMSTCRCRITPCRVTSDCALTGGTCGADQYCVGDFGACTTSGQCQIRATDSVCTLSSTSTQLCP